MTSAPISIFALIRNLKGNCSNLNNIVFLEEIELNQNYQGKSIILDFLQSHANVKSKNHLSDII